MRVCTCWYGSFEGTLVGSHCFVTRWVLVFTRDTCSSHTSTDSRCWSGAVLGPGVGPRCGPPAFSSSPLHSHCGASAQTQRERERKENVRVKGCSNKVKLQVEVEIHVVQLAEGRSVVWRCRGAEPLWLRRRIACSGWSAPLWLRAKSFFLAMTLTAHALRISMDVVMDTQHATIGTNKCSNLELQHKSMLSRCPTTGARVKQLGFPIILEGLSRSDSMQVHHLGGVVHCG